MNLRLLAERIFYRLEYKGWRIVEWGPKEDFTVPQEDVLAEILSLLENEQANKNSNPPSSFA